MVPIFFSLTLYMADIALKGTSKVGPCLPLTLYMVGTTLKGTRRLGPCHSSEIFFVVFPFHATGIPLKQTARVGSCLLILQSCSLILCKADHTLDTLRVGSYILQSLSNAS